MKQSIAVIFEEEEARMLADYKTEQDAFNALPQSERDAIKAKHDARVAAERQPSRCENSEEEDPDL